MSALGKGAKGIRDLAQGSPSAEVNWRLLERAPGHEPQLLWPSIEHPTQVREADSRRIPPMELIGLRYKENGQREERDLLLTCKAFWETFRRSNLVILFDRYGDKRLLRHLRDELESKRPLSLQTLVVFAGTVKRDVNGPEAMRIQNAAIKAGHTLKFHYLDGMESTSIPHPHDRFAVTDGEFWHFGGSVGGIERCLTAVSRGWKAKDVGVEDFVKQAWAHVGGTRP
jgi:hypothetical protein